MESRRSAHHMWSAPPIVPAAGLPHPSATRNENPPAVAVRHPSPWVRGDPAISIRRIIPVAVHEWVPADPYTVRLPEIAVSRHVIIAAVIIQVAEAILIRRLRIISCSLGGVCAESSVALFAPLIQLVGLNTFIERVVGRVHRIKRERLAFFYRHLLARIRIFHTDLALKDGDFKRVLVSSGNTKTAGVLQKHRFASYRDSELIIVPAGNAEQSFALAEINRCQSRAGRGTPQFSKCELAFWSKANCAAVFQLNFRPAIRAGRETGAFGHRLIHGGVLCATVRTQLNFPFCVTETHDAGPRSRYFLIIEIVILRATDRNQRGEEEGQRQEHAFSGKHKELLGQHTILDTLGRVKVLICCNLDDF